MHSGETITDLESLVTRVVPPSPTASEWERFIHEGAPTEFDHDALAELEEE